MARNTTAKPTVTSTTAAPPRGRGGATATVVIILITVLAVTALPLCILLLLGMLPTGVAILVDQHRGRYLARSVGAMNLAGMTPATLQLWTAGISFAGLHTVIANPFTWLAVYGAAAVGWLLHSAVPPMVTMVVEAQAVEMRRRLEARAEALIEEWGEEVAGRKRD